MSRLEKAAYEKASIILTVSRGFKDRLEERGYGSDRVRVILLGADGSLFQNLKPSDTFVQKYNLQGKILAIYTGIHGKANGLDYILAAAEKTLDHKEVVYVLMGEGYEKPRLIEEARKGGLTNVLFADAVTKMEVPGILACCQIGLMILRDLGEPRPVTPNKVFDYMFAGLPVLVNFEGPTWDMLRQEKCGILANPAEGADLAEKVLQLVEDKSLRERLGAKGKKAANEKYDRKSIADQLRGVFEKVLEDNSKKK
jgi:glycosyltransferase involved in cell wall biosynthesis